jgi:Cyclin
MLQFAPSPILHPEARYEASPSYTAREPHHHAKSPPDSPIRAPVGAYSRDHLPQQPQPRTQPNPLSRHQFQKRFPSPPPARRLRRPSSYSPPSKIRRRMVNAATQTTPGTPPANAAPSQTPTHTIASLKIEDKELSPQTSDELSSSSSSSCADVRSAEPLEPAATAPPDSRGKSARSVSQSNPKRQADETSSEVDDQAAKSTQQTDISPAKKVRPDAPALRILPQQYESCDPRDLVILISSMLMELIRYNDAIPLKDGHLTRFHSRAPPGISVQDYLQRLTTHATLSPPILLSMVYYIDRLCALYPAFTITSLTVHRFLIASATVASKGLSDSFWNNKTYARVGGVSIKELALLELEFLTRLEWRIVPKPEVLCDYYVSLVKRSDTHSLDSGSGPQN